MMSRGGGGIAPALARTIVRAAAVLVPHRDRRRWRREWLAELWHREHALRASGAGTVRSSAALIGPALGCLVHACWHRLQVLSLDLARQNVKQAWRSYRRSPGFAVAAVSTLALGIAANVSVFMIAKGALLSPTPYPSAERLAQVVGRDSSRPGESLLLAYPDIEDLSRSPALQSVAAYDWDPFNLRLDDRTEWVGGGRVSAALFETVGISPLQGRFLLPEEARVGGPAVVVLGETLWRRHFAAAPVVGTTVWLDGVAHEVVGVAPDILDIPFGAELWVPLRPTGVTATRDSFWLQAVARLAPGMTWEGTREALDALATGIRRRFPDAYEDRTLDAVALAEHRTGNVRPAFIALLSAVSLLLLVVLTNLTSLVLARADRRGDEFGVRLALGASRTRLIVQLLTESLMLTGAAGVLGYLLGQWTVIGIRRAVPEIPVWFDASGGPAVMLLTIALALISAIVLALTPVMAGITRRTEGVARSGRGLSARPRDVLILSEVALSTVLLLAAGVLVRTLTELNGTDPGFETTGRMAGTVQLPIGTYDTDAKVVAFAADALEAVRARPEVATAAAVTRMPFRSGVNSVMWWEDGQSDDAFRENPQAELNSVTVGYFEAMGIPLVAGRWFTGVDGPEAPAVAIVSRRFVERHFGSVDPIGKRISFTYPPRFVEIVGVAADVKHQGLEQEPRFQIYVPFAQRPTNRLTIVAVGRAESAALAPAMRTAVRSVDADLAMSDLESVDGVVRTSLWRLRLLARAFSGFGVFAALLAAVGIGGVVAQVVARRTREIGIRMALGARRAQILRVVGGRVGVMLVSGLVTGAMAALAIGRVASGLAYDIDAFDPAVFLVVLLGFASVGVLSAALPARRATAIDPTRALKAD